MQRRLLLSIWLLAAYCGAVAGQQAPPPASSSATCIDCHTKISPNVISDWKLSKHSQANVGCTECHGADHTSASDVDNVKVARPEVCAKCHQAQVDQYRNGKHTRALAAMKTQPNIHWRPMAKTLGEPGCVSCHRIGSPRTTEEVKLGKFAGTESGVFAFGGGACDSCHSRHTFSVEEARQPQACEFCHTGPDHDQWAMYASSRHGILNDLKQRKLLPVSAAVPTCQTCHMPEGNHAVSTAWGYWGIRLPMPSDPQWAADRTDVMKALNVVGPEGESSFLQETVKATAVIRFTDADWQQERDKMVKTCSQCHSQDYAKRELQTGDDMIRNADHLMAEAIRLLAALYKDGVLPKPEGRAYPFPWLTNFAPPPTIIEQKAERMFLEYRSRAFQGVFHSSPKYSIGYGLAEMQRELVEIKELAAELRRDRGAPGTRTPAKTPEARKPKAK